MRREAGLEQPAARASLLVPGTLVAFKSGKFGQYLSLDGNTAKTSASVGPKEVFKVVDGGNDEVALHNLANNRYLRMHSKKMDASPCRGDTELPKRWKWERFTAVDGSNGTIALHSTKHNRFVRMKDSSTVDRSDKKAANELPADWDDVRFTVEKLLLVPGDTVALYDAASKTYASMRGETFDASGTKLSPAECFTVVNAGAGAVALHCAAANRFARLTSAGLSATSIKAAAELPSTWNGARFTAVDGGGGTIAFHSNKSGGRFIRVNGTGLIRSDAKAAGELPADWTDARFTIYKVLLVPGDEVALKCKTHNRYYTMNGTDMTSSEQIGAYERFTVVDAGNGEIALHSGAFNRFLRIHFNKALTTKVTAADALPASWLESRFHPVDAGNGEIALHNAKSGRFLRMHKNHNIDTSGMRAVDKLPARWGWERIQVIKLPTLTTSTSTTPTTTPAPTTAAPTTTVAAATAAPTTTVAAATTAAAVNTTQAAVVLNSAAASTTPAPATTVTAPPNATDDHVELSFKSLDYYKTDLAAFRTQLLEGLGTQLGLSKAAQDSMQVLLRPGSIIASLYAPAASLTELRAKPMASLQVMNSTAEVTAGAEPQATTTAAATDAASDDDSFEDPATTTAAATAAAPAAAAPTAQAQEVKDKDGHEVHVAAVASTATTLTHDEHAAPAAAPPPAAAGKPDIGAAAAWILFGLLTCSMLLMHLVHSPDPNVKGSSFKLVSHVMSILGAILLFHCMKDFTNLMVNDEKKALMSGGDGTDGHAHLLMELKAGTRSFLGQGMSGALFSYATLASNTAPGGTPGAGAQVMAVCRFAVAFCLLEFLLRFFKSSPLRLASLGLLGAHFVGFVAADCFATLQEGKPWSEHVHWSYVWVVICAIILGGLKFLCGKIRQKMNEWDGHVDASEKAWEHQCEHAEDEFVAFAMGLLITQAVRFHIMGFVPHFHGVQKNSDAAEVHILGSIAVFFMVLTMLTTFVPMAYRKHPALSTVRLTFAMTAGWSTLFWGKWTFWNMTGGEGLVGGGDVMTAQVVMAVFSSIGGFCFAMFLGKLQTRFAAWLNRESCEALLEATVLVIGLAWESVFMCAIYFANKKRGSEHARVMASLEMCITIVLLVVPVWHMYIMPKALELNPKHADDSHDDEASHKEPAATAESAAPPAPTAEPAAADS